MSYNIRTLQIFEAVYRNGSIAKAAEELSITASAVSHQLKNFREHVGEDLFAKHGRTLVFNEKGKRLAQSLAYAFSGIEVSVQSTIKSRDEQLRVAMCSSFGQGWFIRKMDAIDRLKIDEGMTVKMYMEDPDLSDTVADVFFTTKELKDGFWSTKLFDEQLVAVVGEEYVEPTAEGCSVRLITTDLLDEVFAEDWKRYSAALRPDIDIDTTRATMLGASHYIFALEMAANNVGIALVPDFLADGCLSRGRVKIWNSTRLDSGRSYYMNVKNARVSEPRLSQLITGVRQAAHKDRLRKREAR